MIKQKIFIWDGANVDNLILDLSDEIISGYTLTSMMPEYNDDNPTDMTQCTGVRFTLSAKGRPHGLEQS